jgi:hypothetical protein
MLTEDVHKIGSHTMSHALWAPGRRNVHAENVQDSQGELSTSRLALRMLGSYPGLD